MLPLYEGKMGHQFDHRFQSFVGAGDTDLMLAEDHDPATCVLPRYWVTPQELAVRRDRRTWGSRSTLLGHRRVARNNDERTSIACLLPFGPASYGWILSSGPGAQELAVLAAVFNSTAFDYALRNSFSQPSIPQVTSQQAPVLARNVIGTRQEWLQEAPGDFLTPRVLELTYTAWDLAPFARDLGDSGPPFIWDDQRRFLLRVELDAAFFHLYGIARDDVDYIMETFPIVKRKDIATHGEYRTKRVILEMFDAMQTAMDTGVPYQTPIDPPPGQGRRHPSR